MNSNNLTLNREFSMKIKRYISSESCFAFLLVLIWTENILVKYVKAMLIRIPYISTYREEVIMFVFLAALVLSLPYMFKCIDSRWILIYCLIVVTYILNLIIFPQNKVALIDNMYPFLVKSFPLIFVGMCVDLKKHYKLLCGISYASVILRVIQLIFDPINMVNGDMSGSYQLLPHVCLVIIVGLSRANIVSIIMSFIGAITIISFGTRGPVLCILFLILLYILIFRKNNGVLYLILFLLSICFILFYDDILRFLLQLVKNMGMSTRVIDSLLYGDFMNSAARDSIRRTLLEAIKDNWLGYGIAGDRAIVGMYSHNILIELMVSFGFFGGVAIFGALVYLMIKVLMNKSNTNNEEHGFILALISSSLIKLFLSGTYLTEAFLYLLVGVLIAEYLKIKKVIKTT